VKGRGPSEADFLAFPREVWSLAAIEGALFVVVDWMIWSDTNVPRRRMGLEQFIGPLETFYENTLREAELGSDEGVFEVQK